VSIPSSTPRALGVVGVLSHPFSRLRARILTVDTAVVVALIALAGTAANAGIALYGRLHESQMTARREAEANLSKYREPLIEAAFDLQSRLYNILHAKNRFLREYYFSDVAAEREYAVRHTVYVVAQYLGWAEILRQEVQLLTFPDARDTQAVAELQEEIRYRFSTDRADFGRPFRVWRGDQHAIGEVMIVRDGDRPLRCLGYASFLACTDTSFRRWFSQLEEDVATIAEQPNERLLELQHWLVDLIMQLGRQRHTSGWGGRSEEGALLRFTPERLTKLDRTQTLLEVRDEGQAPADSQRRS
jgi:hypothetical protein